jgi:hypothetical protein
MQATRLFLMAARPGFTDAQIVDALWKGLPKINEIDTAFTAALEAVPAEDWCKTWAAGRAIMLRKASKRVKEIVDKMRLPAGVRLSRTFWHDARNGTAAEKLPLVMRQLAVATARSRIRTLELPRCYMSGQDADCLAGVLAQCPALAHLDFSGNSDFGAGGAERLAGVHLNRSGSRIGAGGAERLARVLGQCTALAHLDLSCNDIGPDGAESLAGVLGQCAALAHLDLSYHALGPDGAESLAGILLQFASLAHLNLGYNDIASAGPERLQECWDSAGTWCT